MRTVVTRLVIGAACWLTLAGVAFAQQATLSGTVRDTTGGVLPGVTITATHEASGNVFNTVTDEQGGYRLPVRTGAYRLLVELPGFTTINRGGLELLLNQQAVVNLEMSPSTVQETVTVSAEAPLVDTTQSRGSGNVDPRQVEELPLNGRNWMDLTMLAPGSRANAASAESPVGNTTRGYFQVNIDGQQVTNNVSGGYLQPGFSRDAIAEFEFLSNRFDASMGRSLGAQVNAITKSGTNTPSGTFSGYFRDDRFNAEDPIAAARASVLQQSAQHDARRSHHQGPPACVRRLRVRDRTVHGPLYEPLSCFQHRSGIHARRPQGVGADSTTRSTRRRGWRCAGTSHCMNRPARAAAAPPTIPRESSASTTWPTGCWRP